jgi:signal transduction histidine kinase
VISDLEVRIQETGAQVEVDGLPTLQADPLQMRQLLQNLIGNALKFHREGEIPVVKIYSPLPDSPHRNSEEGKPADRWCQLIVEDKGIGFDEKYVDRIFGMFQRLHGRGAYEGSGVGLAICRKIAERHGGTITARSTPGEGATFVVALPFQSSSQ